MDRGFTIINTTGKDLDGVLRLFDQAMKLQGQNGYRVWEVVDKAGLERDIKNRLQYKIMQGNDMLCIFSIQFSDPFIWQDRDKNDALYLHRIVVNPNFKGQRQFKKVLSWAKQFVLQKKLRYVRMDTWAENKKLIDYYMSFGFRFLENYRTPDVPELPVQNRNLEVALLELEITA